MSRKDTVRQGYEEFAKPQPNWSNLQANLNRDVKWYDEQGGLVASNSIDAVTEMRRLHAETVECDCRTTFEIGDWVVGIDVSQMDPASPHRHGPGQQGARHLCIDHFKFNAQDEIVEVRYCADEVRIP